MSIPTLQFYLEKCARRYKEIEIVKAYLHLLKEIENEEEMIDLGNGGLKLDENMEESARIFSDDEKELHGELLNEFRGKIHSLIMR